MVLDLINFYNQIVKFEDYLFTLDSKSNYYRVGKWSLFLNPQKNKICYKFFVFHIPCDLKQIKKLKRIHNILWKNNLAPKCTGIASCHIKYPENVKAKKPFMRPKIKIGYGLVLKKETIVKKKDSKESLPQYITRLKKVCRTHRFIRRKSLQDLIKEAKKPRNILYTPTGIKLIDIDPQWQIQTQ